MGSQGNEQAIANKIRFLRGRKIMLDKDLAELYGVAPIRLREQVKRNKERFPSKFMFQLNVKEIEEMVSQNAIPSKMHLGGFRPYAFTEHGVLMLANILRSKKAMQTSIRIIEVFVKIREMLLSNKEILLQIERLERKVDKHDENIQLIFECIKKLLHPPDTPRPRIGFRRRGEED